MIKPDGVQRGLVADIIARFERRGYKLVGLKIRQPTKELLEVRERDPSNYLCRNTTVAMNRRLLIIRCVKFPHTHA